MSFAARGPLKVLLQTAGGQYLVLGIGIYGLFPEQVQKLLAPLLSKYPQLASSLVSSSTSKENEGGSSSSPQQIIIHTPSPTFYHGNRRKGGLEIVAYAAATAGVCWVGYIVCVRILPDAVTQMLPVTKGAFDKATHTLGQGILNVKQVLEEKIRGLSRKQDDLGKKQDETNEAVGDVKKELGEARFDLALLKEAMGECQDSLDTTQGMQAYTLKGVKLLVSCVSTFIPDEGKYLGDIAKFIQEGHGLDDNRSPPRNNHSNSHPAIKGEPQPPLVHAQTLGYVTPNPSKRNNSCVAAVEEVDDCSSTRKIRELIGC